jgi:hypothetical protein
MRKDRVEHPVILSIFLSHISRVPVWNLLCISDTFMDRNRDGNTSHCAWERLTPADARQNSYVGD